MASYKQLKQMDQGSKFSYPFCPDMMLRDNPQDAVPDSTSLTTAFTKKAYEAQKPMLAEIESGLANVDDLNSKITKLLFEKEYVLSKIRENAIKSVMTFTSDFSVKTVVKAKKEFHANGFHSKAVRDLVAFCRKILFDDSSEKAQAVVCFDMYFEETYLQSYCFEDSKNPSQNYAVTLFFRNEENGNEFRVKMPFFCEEYLKRASHRDFPLKGVSVVCPRSRYSEDTYVFHYDLSIIRSMIKKLIEADCVPDEKKFEHYNVTVTNKYLVREESDRWDDYN